MPPPSSPVSPAQVNPDDDQPFWGHAVVAIDVNGHIVTNRSDEVGVATLLDLGGDMFDHTVNQSAVDVDGGAWTAIDRLVASSMAFTRGANLTTVNGAAIRNMVESVIPAVINNVLRRAHGPKIELRTRCLVSDELLAVIELLIEQTYEDLLVGEVLEFRW